MACCGQKRVELARAVPGSAADAAQSAHRTAPRREGSSAPARLASLEGAASSAPVASVEGAASSARVASMADAAPLAQAGLRGHHAPPAAWRSRTLRVEYLERSSIVVRGPVTGRRYAFSARAPVAEVDARDAELLLRTRHFRRLG